MCAERRGKGSRERFTALLHHLNVDLLRDSFYALKRKAAPGVDGMTWREYGDGLEGRLRICTAVFTGERTGHSPREECIYRRPTGGNARWALRRLEDKIVQQAVVTILNQIYEVDFRGFCVWVPARAQSAPGTGRAHMWGSRGSRVNWILDADIRGLLRSRQPRVAGEVSRAPHRGPPSAPPDPEMDEGGVSEDGEWSETKMGTPQGAVISPLLANVYLHYVFDLWAEVWREKVATGDMIVVRYADDLVVGFQHRADAERFLKEFQERLAKFGLELHPDKTRLIEFGRVSRAKPETGGQGKPETFTFLGFTHYCGEELERAIFRFGGKRRGSG